MGSGSEAVLSQSTHCSKRFQGLWIVFFERRTLQSDCKLGSAQIAVGNGGSIPMVTLHIGYLHRIFVCGVGQRRETAYMFPHFHVVRNRGTIAPPIGEGFVRAQTGPIGLVPTVGWSIGVFGIQTNVGVHSDEV